MSIAFLKDAQMELYKSLGYDQPPYLGMYPGFLLGMVIHIESKVCGLVYISFKQENVMWLLVNVNQKCCWLYILSLTVNPLDIIVKGVNDSHTDKEIRQYYHQYRLCLSMM